MYLTHADLSKYWVLDLETNSLINWSTGAFPSKIHCIVLRNVETNEVETYVGPNFDTLNRALHYRLNCGHIFVGHNLISYDCLVLKRLLDIEISLDQLVDTLILSQLYHPKMPGGHSLEVWGERLGVKKPEYYQWDQFSEEMLNRCVVDTQINRELFLQLTERMRQRGFTEKSCWIEHRVHEVLDRQMKNGFFFDEPKARELYKWLREQQEALQTSIHLTFHPWDVMIGEYKYKEKANGQPFASFLRHQQTGLELRWNSDESRYSLWEKQPFNIASPKQRLARLLDLGYQPVKFTKKTKKGGGGNPSIDEESLIQFAKDSGVKEAQQIADWLVCFARANMVETWLGFVDKDQRIRGKVFACGAANRRPIYNDPPIATAPKTKTKYGKECRSLWRAPKERVLVGYDASSLEMRVFGHYLGDAETAKLYYEGDPHTVNQDILQANPWGFKALRDFGAKNGLYALWYGAADLKLGRTFDPSIVKEKEARAYGKWGRQALLSRTKGLEKLVNSLKEELEKQNGFIRCIDGGFVRCNSPHAVLNYKVSSGGAVLMKLVTIRLQELIDKEGWDALRVADIIDEGQFECSLESAPFVGQAAPKVIAQCGEELGFTVPMWGEAKYGVSWNLTH